MWEPNICKELYVELNADSKVKDVRMLYALYIVTRCVLRFHIIKSVLVMCIVAKILYCIYTSMIL